MAVDNHQLQFNQIQGELTNAENARMEGNEGMARVCSRRAVGIAVSIYLSHNGFTDFGASAYERLNILKTLPNISPQVVEIAEHLLLRVNEDHKLPIDIDLIAEARWLIDHLLSDIQIR